MARCAAAAAAALLLVAGRADLSFITLPPSGTRGGSQAAPTKATAVPEELRWEEPEPAVQEVEPAATAGNALRVAVALLAAFVVAIVPMDSAEAARSGGRMGGGAGRMGGGGRMGGMGMGAARPPPPRSAPAPQSSGPNINIGVGPMFAPPLFGPSIFAPPPLFFPPPILPIVVPSGPSYNDRVLQEQQFRDERTIDSQKVQIEQMQKELADLKAKRQ